MRVAIVGSRIIADIRHVEDAVKASGFKITTLICGTARGPDSLGEVLAKNGGVPIEYFKPDWDQYGKRAGYLRNTQMAERAEAVIAVHDGKSRGTLQMMEESRRLHKLLYTHTLKMPTHYIWDILEIYAGANQANRSDFNWQVNNGCTEYRFQGHFGFGGKFWPEQWAISYYPEDKTQQLDELMKFINVELQALKQKSGW